MNKYDARLRLMKASSDDMVAPSLRCEILSGFPLQSHETNTGMAGKSRYEASSDLDEWYHCMVMIKPSGYEQKGAQ